jgi:hypothetical protein
LPDDAPEAAPEDQDQGAPGEADEDDSAASPAYEGLVEGDDPHKKLKDGSEGKEGGPDANDQRAMAAMEVAAANFARLSRVRLNMSVQK